MFHMYIPLTTYHWKLSKLICGHTSSCSPPSLVRVTVRSWNAKSDARIWPSSHVNLSFYCYGASGGSVTVAIGGLRNWGPNSTLRTLHCIWLHTSPPNPWHRCKSRRCASDFTHPLWTTARIFPFFFVFSAVLSTILCMPDSGLSSKRQSIHGRSI